jgi:N-acetylglucosamine repressor
MSLSAVGRNRTLLREHNLSTVLRILRQSGPTSRRKICDMTGLSAATATNLVSKLIEEHVVQEVGTQQHQAVEGGRPRVLLDLNPTGAYVAGLHFGVRFIAGVIGDLRGRIIAQELLPRARDKRPEENLDEAARLCTRLVEATPFDKSRLLGTGVAVVGVVDPADGTVSHAPELNWAAVPARRILERQLGMPIAVDSSSRAMVMSEVLLGAARGARNVVVVHIGTVIGAGLLMEDRLLYGDSNGAGQLGHVTVDPRGAMCECGNVGCLNAVAAEPAIVNQAYQAILDGKRTILSDLAKTQGKLDPPLIYAAALRGDPVAQSVVADVARAIGRGLAQTCVLVNPELIVVTGEIQEVGSAFFQPLCQTMEPRIVPVLGRMPRIVPGSFGNDSGTVGAVALGLARFFHRTDPSAESDAAR